MLKATILLDLMELNFAVGDLVEAKWYRTWYDTIICKVYEDKPGWYMVDFVEDRIKKKTNQVRLKTATDTNCQPSGVNKVCAMENLLLNFIREQRGNVAELQEAIIKR